LDCETAGLAAANRGKARGSTRDNRRKMCIEVLPELVCGDSGSNLPTGGITDHHQKW
jgi:hypothetical protein